MKLGSMELSSSVSAERGRTVEICLSSWLICLVDDVNNSMSWRTQLLQPGSKRTLEADRHMIHLLNFKIESPYKMEFGRSNSGLGLS